MLPRTLTCKSSLGSPSAAERVAPGSQWWIRDTWSQPGLPGAACRLTPATGEEKKKRKKQGFLGRAHDGASCCRSWRAGWACGAGSGAGSGRQGTAALPAPEPPTLAHHRSQTHPVPAPTPQLGRFSPNSWGSWEAGGEQGTPRGKPAAAGRQRPVPRRSYDISGNGEETRA